MSRAIPLPLYAPLTFVSACIDNPLQSESKISNAT